MGGTVTTRPDDEELVDALQDLINAKDLDESKRIIDAHVDLLLSDTAEQLLAFLFQRYAGSANALEVLEWNRSLLLRCRTQGIEEAFACLASPPEMPTDLASLLEDLSSPALSLKEMPRRVEICQKALSLIGRYQHPELWAVLKNEMGNSLSQNPMGVRAENLEQAIFHILQALEVYTREAFPERWAMTQNNLAIAYRERIRGERAGNLEQAIFHYQQALVVRTKQAFPADHRQTQRNLGNLYFDERDWSPALSAYQSAIATGDDLLASAYTEAGRQAEVGENARLFVRASFCLLQNHQYADALLVLERGKTRLLSEALALADLDARSLPEQHRNQLLTARQAVKTLEALIRQNPDLGGHGDRQGRSLVAQLQEKRAELLAVIAAIRQDHPDFMPAGLELPEILALIPSEGALVAPLFTTQGSAVFIIPHGETEVTTAHVIRLDDFKEEHLNTLLSGSEEQPGWLHAYEAYYKTRHLKNWQDAIESLTQRLWQALIDPIHQRLLELNVRRVLLLPSGGLQLLPLHAAWRNNEDGRKRALLDDYEITFAPSAYALDVANRRAKARSAIAAPGQKALVAGINDYPPPNRLVNAVPEAKAVAHILGTEPLLDAAATKSAVKSGTAGAAYLHLSCHGSFNWPNPMDSALYLANDESLKLSEIISELDLRSSLLVTLSACETGISEVRQSPDEYLGLPAGFLQAGAPAIVSSLWTVDDRSTALLMERFYRNHIKLRLSGPAALQEAQLWLRGATRKELGDYYKAFIRMSAEEAFEAFISISGAPDDRPYENPFYWAAFTFNGPNQQ